MKKKFAVVLFVAVIVGIVALALKDPSPEGMAVQTPTAYTTSSPVAHNLPTESTAQTADSSMKTINNEQDSQADRCKNGDSNACDKERAIAEFKKALGQ